MWGPSQSNLDPSEHKESISKNTFLNVTMLLYYIWFNVQVFEMVGLFYIGNRICLPLSKFLNFLWVRKGKEKFGGWNFFHIEYIEQGIMCMEQYELHISYLHLVCE